MLPRQQFKANAKINLRRNYWACVGAGFLMSLLQGSTGSAGSAADTAGDLTSGTSSGGVLDGISAQDPLTMFGIAGSIVIVVLGILLIALVGNVIHVGGKRFFIDNRTEIPSVGSVFRMFKGGHYGNVVVTMFLMNLYIFLWSLLLVIPGIVKSLEYMMVPYILAENPGMDRKSAFAISKRMMDGRKMDAFVMYLSFVPWNLLGVITCGIANIFYVQPYMEASFAEFYAFNKERAYNEGYIQ